MASGRVGSSDAGALWLPTSVSLTLAPTLRSCVTAPSPPHPTLPSVQLSCSFTLKGKIGVFLSISAALPSLVPCSSP